MPRATAARPVARNVKVHYSLSGAPIGFPWVVSETGPDGVTREVQCTEVKMDGCLGTTRFEPTRPTNPKGWIDVYGVVSFSGTVAVITRAPAAKRRGT